MARKKSECRKKVGMAKKSRNGKKKSRNGKKSYDFLKVRNGVGLLKKSELVRMEQPDWLRGKNVRLDPKSPNSSAGALTLLLLSLNHKNKKLKIIPT